MITENVTLSSALDDLQSSPIDEREIEYVFEEDFSSLRVKAERAYVELNALKDHYQHKSYWSWFLMLIMFIMVIFQMILLRQVGIDDWDFSNYQWLLPTLMIQYLAQIVGLAVFVVKSLFKDLH